MAFDIRNSRTVKDFGVTSLAVLGLFPAAVGGAELQVGAGQNSLAANSSGASYSRKITPSPRMTANYHIDRGEQNLYREGRSITIPAPSGGWSGNLVTVKFTALLGMKESELPESRNFGAQQVHFLRIFGPDGKELRFVDAANVSKLKPTDHGFWTLENGQLTGHSAVAVRVQGPGKGSTEPVQVRYYFCKTDIREQIVDGADPDGYRAPISNKAELVGLELAENGYTIDAGKLVDLFQSRGMVDSDFRVSDLLIQMLRYANTLTYARGGAGANQNVNAFFENPANGTGDCHMNTQFGLGARVFGVPAFKASGIHYGSNAGHATSRFYDSQLGDFVPADFSYAAAGPKGVNFSKPSQFPTVSGLTYFELDATELQAGGIAGITGDIRTRITRFETTCGSARGWDGTTYLGKSWPAYIEGSGSTVKLKRTDIGYAEFKTGVGPTFPNGRPKE